MPELGRKVDRCDFGRIKRVELKEVKWRQKEQGSVKWNRAFGATVGSNYLSLVMEDAEHSIYNLVKVRISDC